ncbi:IMP1 inner mitochondrial membrane peptidase-like protein [Endogone sp. FLAS-F59071]|nr:IMP1 inner mitochondrial membrane peptidase-like protein [Endogone sp. FLAS-F59071]|eukprot:RUS21821.1 IMP1 inner mitochondrial membrane peptidase-like protein [Endogone sp. FLAS-F59071]
MNVLRKIGYLVQFGCFIHIFNQPLNASDDKHGWRPGRTGTHIAAAQALKCRRRCCLRIPDESGSGCMQADIGHGVPPGHVWLGGDNMSNSTDSRLYGPVPLALVKGRVFARVWPEPGWIRNGLVPIK